MVRYNAYGVVFCLSAKLDCHDFSYETPTLDARGDTFVSSKTANEWRSSRNDTDLKFRLPEILIFRSSLMPICYNAGCLKVWVLINLNDKEIATPSVARLAMTYP